MPRLLQRLKRVNSWLRMHWWDWLIVCAFLLAMALVAWPDLLAWVNGDQIVGYR
jgi:hypothetical protein